MTGPCCLLKRAFHTSCSLISTHFGSFTPPAASRLSFVLPNHGPAPTTLYLIAFSFANTIYKAIYLSRRKPCVCVHGWEITACLEMQKLFQLHLWSGIWVWWRRGAALKLNLSELALVINGIPLLWLRLVKKTAQKSDTQTGFLRRWVTCLARRYFKNRRSFLYKSFDACGKVFGFCDDSPEPEKDVTSEAGESWFF